MDPQPPTPARSLEHQRADDERRAEVLAAEAALRLAEAAWRADPENPETLAAFEAALDAISALFGAT